MSVFKLGFLVNYVSHSVICGFTCAASIIIAFSQVKKLLGLKNIGRHFYEAIVDVPKNLHKTRVSDLVVGLICMGKGFLVKNLVRYTRSLRVSIFNR